MKTMMKALALGALLTTLAGGAFAAEGAMNDCCAKCDCCKDKKADGQGAPEQPKPAPEHQHQH